MAEIVDLLTDASEWCQNKGEAAEDGTKAHTEGKARRVGLKASTRLNLFLLFFGKAADLGADWLIVHKVSTEHGLNMTPYTLQLRSNYALITLYTYALITLIVHKVSTEQMVSTTVVSRTIVNETVVGPDTMLETTMITTL